MTKYLSPNCLSRLPNFWCFRNFKLKIIYNGKKLITFKVINY